MSDTDTIAEQLSPVKRALLEIRQLRAQLAAVQRTTREPMAIVSAAVRLPGGVCDLDAFWNLLNADDDAIGPIPRERWDAAAVFSSDVDEPGKTYSRHGGFLADIEQFDAAFFGISPREAESMDPQHRLLLELTWEALENAAIAPASLAGSKTGVYIGLSNSDYGRLLLSERETIDAYTSFGTASSIAAGRLSYFLDVKGPSLVVDTACSASLTAVHLACTSLAAGEADLAIVGATNLLLSPDTTIALSKARMLAPDGRCKTFDDEANGYVRGEGGAVIVLKRLSDARAANDPIMAVIRSSAVNHDGRSAGLTAPNGPAQEAVIRSALRMADVEPTAIDYVETHGTGTALGDPIELQALANVFERAAGEPLRIGSIKRKLGHLEAVGGIAGLIKLALALDREQLPAHGAVKRPTSMFAWDTAGLEIAETRRSWRRGERPRMAGVSAFSFSGTNVHAIIEEAPPLVATLPGPESSWLFCLSAKTDSALREIVERYADWLGGTHETIADICFSVNAGRSHHRHRLAVRVSSKGELVRDLRAWLDGAAVANILTGRTEEPEPDVTFVFPDRTVDAERIAQTLRGESSAFDRLWRATDFSPNDSSGTSDERAAAASVALESTLARLFEECGVHASPAAADAHVVSLGADASYAALLATLQRLYVAGVTIAWEHLGRGARRVPSLPTYPFERRAYWRPRDPSVETPTATATWPRIVAAAAQQSDSGPLGWDVAAYVERWACFEDLTAGYVANTLVALGAFCAPGEMRTVDDLIATYAITPLYSGLVLRWLRLLVQRGELRCEGETFISDRALAKRDVSAIWPEVERLLADDPDVLAYTRRASGKLFDLLTGRVNALDILFERGALDTAEGIYGRSPSARYFNALVAAAVRVALSDRDSHEPFRLLEAGAGTGGTTAAIAPFFPTGGEYWFTDVSDVFIARAKSTFGHSAAFRFAKLDLDAMDGPDSSFGTFDVVVAANVVHATRDVGATLDRMRGLLNPGGILILVETTLHHAAIDLTIGFIEGWSTFDDSHRSRHPLLDADRWCALSLERGFAAAARFPAAGSAADVVGQHVIIARNDDGVRTSGSYGDATVSTVNVSLPALELGSLNDDERRARLRVFAAGCVRHVLRLDAESGPGLRDRFTDLGMDSLMALQLKSVLESGLGVDDALSATIAFDTGTVEALAEQLFVVVSPQRPATVTVTRSEEMISAETLSSYSDSEVEAMLMERLRTRSNPVGPS